MLEQADHREIPDYLDLLEFLDYKVSQGSLDQEEALVVQVKLARQVGNSVLSHVVSKSARTNYSKKVYPVLLDQLVTPDYLEHLELMETRDHPEIQDCLEILEQLVKWE